MASVYQFLAYLYSLVESFVIFMKEISIKDFILSDVGYKKDYDPLLSSLSL